MEQGRSYKLSDNVGFTTALNNDIQRRAFTFGEKIYIQIDTRTKAPTPNAERRPVYKTQAFVDKYPYCATGFHMYVQVDPDDPLEHFEQRPDGVWVILKPLEKVAGTKRVYRVVTQKG